jgi:PAS domain S-box-containing protein
MNSSNVSSAWTHKAVRRKVMTDFFGKSAPMERPPDTTTGAPHLTHSEPAGTWVWDITSDCLVTDESFAKLNSLDSLATAKGVPTAAFFSAIHPEDRPRIRIAVAAILNGAEVFSKEYRLLTADGSVKWVHARGRCILDDEDQPRRFSGILVDITEQKRVEERLRVAQEAGEVGTFEYIVGFGTATVSEKFCHLLGLLPATVLPVVTINSVVAPGSPSLIDAESRTASGAMSYVELCINRADNGEVRWLARRGQHVRDAETAGLRFTGVIYDVTATKRAAEKLRELNETLEKRVRERTRERDSVWSLSRDLFGVFGLDGRISVTNPAWTELLGYRSDEIGGVPLDDLFHSDDLNSYREQLKTLESGVSIRDFDMRVRGKDGAIHWINWTFTPEGEVFYGVGRDVTQRKLLEEQLRQSQKMEAVGQLTGGIAHDFNNLLTGIVGSLDLMQTRIAQGRTETIDRYAKAAMSSANRAAALTHRLLAFARRQPLNPKPVDANHLVTSMEDLLRRTLSEAIRLRLATSQELWLTRCDPHQLESAVLNLVINARDAMPNGGQLTVETANAHFANTDAAARQDVEPGEYVAICVSDNGFGMPRDVIAQAFDPFFTTKPIGQGTGLGLSMVYGFAKQSDGHVRIASEVGQGTTVTIYLPRYHGDLEQESPLTGLGDANRAEAGETVLVVEDDTVVRALIVEVLQDLGYHAIEAADGPSGLKFLESGRHIDLLVTDVGLPGLNGRQLADRARVVRPDLKVLFITGYADNAAMASGFLPPGMEMITKPFAVESLATRIRSLIEKT